MNSMEFFLVFPVVGLSLWIIFGTLGILRREGLSGAMWAWLIILLGVGVGLGFWFAFNCRYSPSATTRVTGFPVPFQSARLIKGRWILFVAPSLMKEIAMATNFITGLAFGILPLTVHYWFRQIRHTWRNRPPMDGPPSNP